jgi:hypothetical protein
MLDIHSVIAPPKARTPFHGHAEAWTLARDRYLAGALPYAGLVGATRLLLARAFSRLKGLSLFYDDSREHTLVAVTAVTTNHFTFALPSFDDRLGMHGPPWFQEPALSYLAAHMDSDSFEEAGRVLSDMLGGLSTDYDDVCFLLLSIAFVARDSEGSLTTLPVR